MHFGLLAPAPFAVALIIVLGAFMVRGMLGFGSGLISVALLIIFLPVKLAVPVVFIIDSLASLALGTYDFKQIRWREIGWLWPGTVAGLVAGAYVLKHAPAQNITVLLGIFILGYVLYAFVVRPERLPKTDRVWGAPLGVLGGLMGSLYGGGGPAIVAYLQMRHLDKRDFRATFQFVAVSDSVVRGTFYFAMGLITGSVVATAVWLVPAVAIGLWVGNRLHFRINARRFQQAVLVTLAVAGLKLVIPF